MVEQTYALAQSGVYGLKNGAYADALVPDSGLSRWTYDDTDTETGTALDAWGDNDATINGATTGGSGLAGYDSGESYSLDGTDDYIESAGPLISELTAWSMAIWFKTTTSQDGAKIIGDYDGGVGAMVAMWDHDGDGTNELVVRQRGSSDNADGVAYDADLADGSAHHVVATRGGSGASNLSLYIDGAEVTTEVEADQGSSTVTANVFSVGRRDGGNWYFAGDVDDPRTYGKELTASEVSNLYETGSING